MAAAQIACRVHQRTRAGRELVKLDVESVEPAQGGDLIAHEAAALGVLGVGQHVGDDQGAHAPDRSALE